MAEPSASRSVESDPVFVVGIGASAGGLEALESFFTHMPSDSGMAFVVVQHLSPDYKSMMVELLSKRTDMPVRRAEEGVAVESNTVYLIPPNRDLAIFHGRLLLTEREHTRGLNLPIDVFLRSLADDQGEKAVAVILSGTGSDGVRGVRAVKEAGGLVMVQSEESARFDGMPRAAISTGLADCVVSPDEMPARLLSFARRPWTSTAERPQALMSDEDGLTRIFSMLRERTRVDFTYYKPTTLVRRIERRMTMNQMEGLRDYVRYMEAHPGEVTALYRELLIGVTSFFRDREVFEEIEHVYLPRLFEGLDRKEIRFWVAGCSTGEEAYSLAILSREVMERMERRVDVRIFSTDIDRDAIERAGGGIYPESIAADLSPKLLAKYFHRREDRYQVDRSIREMVVFAQHNLIKDPPFTNLDLVSCRNLLIYLQPVLQKKALDLMNYGLNAQGILLLGTSETPGEAADCFELLHPKFKIYSSRGRRRPLAEAGDVIGVTEPRTWRTRSRVAAMGLGTRAQEEERLLERLLQTVSAEYIPFTVVVNEQMEAVYILGDAEGYLHLPSGKLQNDVTKMAARDLAIPLATGLQKVFSSRTELKFTNVRMHHGDRVQTVQLRILPLPARKGQDELAAVFFEPTVESQPEAGTRSVQVFDVSHEAEQRIHDLEQELQFSRENLQATIEELETSNEELQATNEELLASNEELQSTNEELQSVNEELHTVNAEYQRKVIELTELNNDLNNLMEVTGIGTLFLDENLEVRKFTPELQRIFRILEGDLGRPVEHLAHMLEPPGPFEVIRNAARRAQGIESEVQAMDGAAFVMKAMPYRIGSGRYSGIVVTFTEITKRKQVEAALWKERERSRSYLDVVQAFMVALDSDGRITMINRAGCELLGYEESELLGMDWFEACLPQPLGRDTVRPEFERIMASSMVPMQSYENPVLCRDGRQRLMAWHNAPVVDEAGRCVGVLTSGHDITEQQCAREESDSLARFPAENPNPVLRVGRDGTLLYGNRAALPLLSAWGVDVGGQAPDHVIDAATRALSTTVAGTLDLGTDGTLLAFSVVPISDRGYVNFYGQDLTACRMRCGQNQGRCPTEGVFSDEWS